MRVLRIKFKNFVISENLTVFKKDTARSASNQFDRMEDVVLRFNCDNILKEKDRRGKNEY